MGGSLVCYLRLICGMRWWDAVGEAGAGKLGAMRNGGRSLVRREGKKIRGKKILSGGDLDEWVARVLFAFDLWYEVVGCCGWGRCGEAGGDAEWREELGPEGGYKN